MAATFTVTLLKATNTGHRITSTSGLHTAEQAAQIINSRLTEDNGECVTAARLDSRPYTSDIIDIDTGTFYAVTRHDA